MASVQSSCCYFVSEKIMAINNLLDPIVKFLRDQTCEIDGFVSQLHRKVRFSPIL